MNSVNFSKTEALQTALLDLENSQKLKQSHATLSTRLAASRSHNSILLQEIDTQKKKIDALEQKLSDVDPLQFKINCDRIVHLEDQLIQANLKVENLRK